MANYQIDKNTGKKLSPFIKDLYTAIFNENELIKTLPSFEDVFDEGVSNGYRNLKLKFKGNSYRLSLFSYVRNNGNCLAVRDLDTNANLIQLVLDKFCEIKANGIYIWHNGIITGISDLNSEELISYIASKVPALVKTEDDYEFIELGMLDNKSPYSLSDSILLNFISNLLIFSILRKQIKNDYRSGVSEEIKDTIEKPIFLLVNITWNSENWERPTHEKSGHGWVSKGNTPHESWNFDFANTRNPAEKIYGFSQFTASPKIKGNNNLIIFYSKKHIVGFYGKAEVLAQNVDINKKESYNLIGEKALSLILKNKIGDVKQKGFMEDLFRVGQVGFSYIKKRSTVLSILNEALRLNPESSDKLNALISWIKKTGQKIEQHMENDLHKNLNTILYGPPGTGKTYNTIIKAAKIITAKELDYKKAKDIYDQLLGDQVEFITFHQNYSYEDFMTGLKPDIKKDELRFVLQEGVFFKICKRARDNYYANREGLHPTEPSFQKVVFEFLKPLQESADGIPIKMDVGNTSFTITGSGGDFFEFKKSGSDTAEALKIDTLKSLYQNEIGPDTEGKHIYYTPLVKHLRALAGKLKNEIQFVELKNYVLIIDEINRANISRVFGELITLLEKDKRLGNSHEMTVTLSNNEKFSVPKNLYIIGTMNTADKSIALLDIALRRRFVFENIYPRPDLIDELVQPPYNEFLKVLNEQILLKKGPDFLIGHSYLMPDEGEELDFLTAMNQKIIPLLNEYFYNQRNISVFSLLESAITKVPGFTVERDDYVGVICKQIS